MAETNKIVNRTSTHVKVTEGSGTPLTYSFKLAGPPSWSLNLPQESEPVMGQQGGSGVIEAVSFNGVSGPSTLKFMMFEQDPANTTDATALEWVSQMERNSFSGGLSTFTSTNSLPLSGKACAIWQVTYENVGASNADHTYAADGYVDSIGDPQVVNGSYAREVTVKIVEAWTKAIV